MFSTSTEVLEPINTTGHGFSKEDINDHIYDIDADGFTATSEGLYQGWNQLRLVPFAEQSEMRVIILFADEDEGMIHGVESGDEFPRRAGMGTNRPQVWSLYEAYGTEEDSDGDFPNHPANANNAARNLLEIIANEVRSDTSGKFPIRIYTLGLGDILNENMGTINETGASILRRVANQQANNPFYDPTQLEGKYYYAGDTDQLNAAFREVASQITRLSQ